jgi:hypothetical protein
MFVDEREQALAVAGIRRQLHHPGGDLLIVQPML